ncbi:putative 13 kDa ribonucleoprotein-associated protein [Xylariaceae sp. FL0255]|nr:putative 13 kDa ribonucleoprotein-associated protein [Xylariaceae sp. FL0255]
MATQTGVTTSAQSGLDAIRNLLAGPALTQQILDVVQQCSHAHQIKKGANEVLKSLNRNKSELVIVASDAEPLPIVMQFPEVCEDKNVPYIFVPSKQALGRACGINRSVIAVTIETNAAGTLKGKIDTLIAECQKAVV